MKLRGVRVFILMAIFIAVTACFTLRLMKYQITEGASYRQKSNQSTVESITIAAPRGEILDRYGRVLATNNVGYSVIIEKAGFPSKTSGKQNDTILELTGILAKNSETWSDTLPVSSAAPYAFTQGSESDQKYLRSLLEIKDGQTLTAADAMKRLTARYSISKSYTPQQIRTVAGVRYEMEKEDFNYTKVFTVAKNVSLTTINQISERTIPGIEIGQDYSRTYPDGTAAPQEIGTVGQIQPDQYKQLKKDKTRNYQLNDIVGQSGIELSMESYLRGTDGKENIVVNNSGSVTGKEVTKKPQPGNNVVLTLDTDLQHVLYNSLQSTIQGIIASAHGDTSKGANANAGAAVVVNIKTGEILGMVSYPGYDNNNYYTQFSSLSKDTSQPLFNRAIKGTYRPGSTFKLCTAVSGLMNGVISGSTEIDCNGSYMKYAPSYIGHDDVSPGPISVTNAIGMSSNVFFDTVADWLNLKNSLLLENTAKALGLGVKTGVELPGEKAGVVSGPTEAKARGNGWHYADAVQTGIGQFDNKYTPLQLADYIGSVVNGGKLYKTHIVKEIKSYDNSSTVVDKTPTVASDLKLSDEIVNLCKQGMLKVTQDGGTAGAVFANYSLTVGGKTGTPQIGSQHNGLFIGFAPYDNPQIAVAVVIENAPWGSTTAPVAKSVFDYFFLNNPDYTAQQQPVQANQLIH